MFHPRPLWSFPSRAAVLVAALVSTLPAADNVRIDLLAKDADLVDVAIITGKGTMKESSWLGEARKKQSRALSFAIPKSTWTKITLSASVSASADVELTLRGPDKRLAAGSPRIPVLVTYDDVSVRGADIKNGGFEAVNSKGYPEDWVFTRDEQGLAKVVSQGAWEAARAMVAWHDGRVSQNLHLSVGAPATISFYAYSEVDPEAP